MQLFILNKLTNILGDINPKTMDNLEIVIDVINDVKVCIGGPDIHEYKNVQYKQAYKDVLNKWRHSSCNLVVVKGVICRHCLKLHAILRRINYEMSSSQSGKKTKKVEDEKIDHHNENSLDDKYEAKVKELNKDIQDCEAEMLKLAELSTLQEHYTNLLMQKQYSTKDS